MIALLDANGMDTSLAYQADVRNETEIGECIKDVHARFGAVDYLLHGVAYGNHRVMCSAIPGTQDEPSRYLDIPFEDLMDSFNISASIRVVIEALVGQERCLMGNQCNTNQPMQTSSSSYSVASCFTARVDTHCAA